MKSTPMKFTLSAVAFGTVKLIEKVLLTKWTATQPVTKQLSLGADGSIEKTSTAAKLYEGSITRLACNPGEFIKVLQDVGPNDCLSYGLPINERATKVTTSAKFEQAGRPDDLMPRTAAAMKWSSGPGILMVDFDPEETVLTPEELREALYLCCPPLRDTAHAWATSTSSCLFNAKTKDEVRGIRGQRVYMFVADAADIPRAAKVLGKRAWLNGYGYIKISKTGSLLLRCIVDESVFQTNRIDYCAPPICESPLMQKKPKPELHGDPLLVLDTRAALPDLAPDEESRYELLVKAAKDARAADAKVVREQYIEARADEYVAKGMETAAAVMMITQSLEGQVLGADFVLRSEDGIEVTVGEILGDRARWQGKNFCDPIEPDYHDDDRIARAYLNGPGRPIISSFAHGGCTYYLSHATETIRMTGGERHSYMDRMATALGERSEFYQHAGRLVSVSDDNRFLEQSEHHVLTVFDRSFRFEKYSAKTKDWYPTDPSLELAKHFRGAFGSGFLPIKAIVTAPIIDPRNQRLITISGYDMDTGIYASLPDDLCPVIEKPTMADIENALSLLWRSVSEFPYVEAIDETVMLTAMLTAVLRPLLPTAPGFAFDAPVQSSGKSLLTMVLSALGGMKPTMSPWPGSRGEAEVNKTIFSMLMEGRPVIVFDNVLGEVDSPSLAAVLTATDDYSDRILGKSRMGTAPTNALILMSGNNIKLKGDLPRRFLKCRIDPRIEKPHQRIFKFNPVTVVQADRQRIVSAALTIFKGHFAAGITERLGAGSTGSFDVWDDIVRQTVCWLADLQDRGLLPKDETADGRRVPRLVDPFNAIDNAVDDDPILMQLEQLHSAWAAQVGTGFGTKTTIKNLIKLHGPGSYIWSPRQATMTDPDSPRLSEVLHDIAGNPFNTTINNKKLAAYLGAHAGRVIDGRRHCAGEPYQGALTWWVEDVGDSRDFGELDLATSKKKSNISLIESAKTNSPKSPNSPRVLRPPPKAA